MNDNDTLDCCLDLMRRLPPINIEKNLSAIIDLTPEDMLQDLLSSIDQPLKVSMCKLTRRQYLICDYNRDGDSYRSPWSNQYDPPFKDGAMPSEKLRGLEQRCNAAFEQYREMYFEGGISSCYLWDIEDHNFAGVLLIKKAGEGSEKIKGCWDSIHVFEVNIRSKDTKYKLTSTVMLWLQTEKMSGKLHLGGSLTRQSEICLPVKKYEDHVGNIGQAVEDMENKMRQTMSTIYFSKTKDILNGLRSMGNPDDEKMKRRLQDDLISKLKAKQ